MSYKALLGLLLEFVRACFGAGPGMLVSDLFLLPAVVLGDGIFFGAGTWAIAVA